MRIFLTFLAALALVVPAGAQPRRIIRPKEKKQPDQTLPLPKEPPAAVRADAARLRFQVSSLSDKGLLTPQTRDALKELMQEAHGGTLVKLRAFVAGTGDLRRVQGLVSEAYEGKKDPLPALTLIQVGALPLEGAQVVIESTFEDKKTVNPHGVAFFSGSPAELSSAAESAHVAASDVLRVTCFLPSLDQSQQIRSSLSSAFPDAAVNIVQPLRDGAGSASLCDGIGRPGSGTPSKLVFTGLQMAFGQQDPDLRLAFDRLRKTLDEGGAGDGIVMYLNLYSLSRGALEKGSDIARQLMFTPVQPLWVENLPSIDASLGIEAVAAVRK